MGCTQTSDLYSCELIKGCYFEGAESGTCYTAIKMVINIDPFEQRNWHREGFIKCFINTLTLLLQYINFQYCSEQRQGRNSVVSINLIKYPLSDHNASQGQLLENNITGSLGLPLYLANNGILEWEKILTYHIYSKRLMSKI